MLFCSVMIITATVKEFFFQNSAAYSKITAFTTILAHECTFFLNDNGDKTTTAVTVHVFLLLSKACLICNECLAKTLDL